MSDRRAPSRLAPSRLALGREQVALLREISEICYPYEACGFLLGRREAGAARVEEVLHGRNLDAASAGPRRERRLDRYRLDPREILSAERVARARRQEVLGFWHSHPDGRPVPSRLDEHSPWRERSYLIVSIDPLGETVIRSYRARADGLASEPIALL